MITLEQLYQHSIERLKRPPAPERLLSLDPGETTGFAHFAGPLFVHANQISTSSQQLALGELTTLLEEYKPTLVVIEDYRVYANRTAQHAGSSLSTPRLIGMIETLLLQRDIPFHKQPAGVAKQFVTDDKLKAWGLYSRGLKHARDAIRHGLYFILFPPKAVFSKMIQPGVSRNAGRHVG